VAMLAGGATRVINCEIGDDLAGQLHRRICERVRDDLEANLLYLSDGETQLLLASLDLLGVGGTLLVELRRQIETATGIPARSVVITCTHTHDGPVLNALLHDAPTNESYEAKLQGWLVEAAKEAVASARPARLGWGKGVARVGYSRRMCWADGVHTMYNPRGRESPQPLFTGLEGPDDPSHAVLFAVDARDKCIALIHNNTCHATCMENATFASADFPGEARALLRSALGADLPVLYLQGASGDISPWDLSKPRPADGERRAREMGAVLAGETFELIHRAQPTETPVLGHVFEDVEMGVRLPTPEALARAREIAALGEEKAGRGSYVLAVNGVLALWDQFRDRPFDTLPVHAIRIGDCALVTNPCELYCQFGLDTKRRSPAAVTVVVQLADGSSGYCPTIPAIMGGGYSGEAIRWARLEPYAGYKLVEASCRLLRQVWDQG